jgi:hypothetical protein
VVQNRDNWWTVVNIVIGPLGFVKGLDELSTSTYS